MADKEIKDVDDEKQGEEKEDDNNDEKVGSSTSNLAELLHGGRPKDEEPHVKKSGKKKGDDENIEYIVRVDLVGEKSGKNCLILYNFAGESWD